MLTGLAVLCSPVMRNLFHVCLSLSWFWFLDVLPNIVKHVRTLLNWFGNLCVFTLREIWCMYALDSLVHVMLVYPCSGFDFSRSFQTSSNMFAQCSTGLEWSCFHAWILGLEQTVYIMLLVFVSQGLSKHRQTCLHNAQLVWKSCVFKSREICFVLIIGLEQIVSCHACLSIVWFLVSGGPSKHRQTCSHNAQLV